MNIVPIVPGIEQIQLGRAVCLTTHQSLSSYGVQVSCDLVREKRDQNWLPADFLGVLATYNRRVSRRANPPQFRRITPGIETLRSSFSLPRHRHLRPYAIVVLAGNFEESGFFGRIRATAGDVLVHPALDCHANQKVCAGVQLIRLYLNDATATGGLYRLNEVDTLAKTAEEDVDAAALLLEETLDQNQSTSPGTRNDWPDMLAAALAQNASMAIGSWAQANGLARETVSRGFAAAYDTAPEVFRAELRARAAWLRITRGSDCLCQIAAETGFADQAHMTRWIHRITGSPPGAWRRKACLPEAS